MCPHCDLRWWLSMAGRTMARFRPSPTKDYPQGVEARIQGSFAKWYPQKPFSCTCDHARPLQLATRTSAGSSMYRS
jgi:hypothetical protein